jgi:hypothetical protein
MAAEPLYHAAAARHQRTVEPAERALRELDAEGAVISFQSVARRGGVSRQWLYTQPALRSAIERLRNRPSAEAGGIPARQRAPKPRCASVSRRCAPRTGDCARRTRTSRRSSRSPAASSAPPKAGERSRCDRWLVPASPVTTLSLAAGEVYWPTR